MNVSNLSDLAAVYLDGDPTIGWEGAWGHFRRPNGRSGTAATMKSLLRRHVLGVELELDAGDERATEDGLYGAVRRLGELPPDQFMPADLRLCQQHMVDAGISRRICNENVSRIRQWCKWAVEYELMQLATLERLKLVRGLKAGRTSHAAEERDAVRSAPDDEIERVLRCARPELARAITVQWRTAMRPGELVAMTAGDIVRRGTGGDGEAWEYYPSYHKTDRYGVVRCVLIGPEVQGALMKQIATLGAGLWPADDTKIWPWQTENGYYQAVRRARERALCAWTPNQLRHSMATEVTRAAGGDREAARQLLGHTDDRTTRIYTDPNMDKARELIRKIG